MARKGSAPKGKQADVVTGIVRSVGGFTGGTEGGGSTLVLVLTPWMPASAKPVDRPLRVEVRVQAAEIDRTMRRVKIGTTVEVDLERLERSTGGRWLGVGRAPVRSAKAKPALETLRRSIERPAAMEDPRLGRLTLEVGPIIAERNDQQAPDSFTGGVRLGGWRCELSIVLTPGSRAHTRSARARDRRDVARAGAVVAKLEEDLPKILGAIVRRYLPLYNDSCHAIRHALQADAFRKRLEPWSVSIGSEGSARLWIKTGDLFEGQVVLARFDKALALCELRLVTWGTA